MHRHLYVLRGLLWRKSRKLPHFNRYRTFGISLHQRGCLWKGESIASNHAHTHTYIYIHITTTGESYCEQWGSYTAIYIYIYIYYGTQIAPMSKVTWTIFYKMEHAIMFVFQLNRDWLRAKTNGLCFSYWRMNLLTKLKVWCFYPHSVVHRRTRHELCSRALQPDGQVLFDNVYHQRAPQGRFPNLFK